MTKFRESQTAKNLLTAFAGESQARNRCTYFARHARDEGFIQIADIFEETANQECEHALRFSKFFNKSVRPVSKPRHILNCWGKTGSRSEYRV